MSAPSVSSKTAFPSENDIAESCPPIVAKSSSLFPRIKKISEAVGIPPPGTLIPDISNSMYIVPLPFATFPVSCTCQFLSSIKSALAHPPVLDLKASVSSLLAQVRNSRSSL